MRNLTLLVIIACGFLVSPPVMADDLLGPETAVSVAVDTYIDQRLEARGITAGPAADDATVLRRTTLDLAGRIPTAKEQQWYFDLPAAERREALVDRLMKSPDFDFHLRNSLDEMLLPNRRNDGEFRDYLLWAITTQRPWDQMFRDMILARQADGPEKGATQFVASRINNLDDMTNDTAVLFFGVNVSCAKCHDHPLVDAWKQDHFYGMQSFFSRTFATRKNVVTERPFGELKFKTTAGEEKSAAFMFLNGKTFEDKTPAFSDDERKQLDEQLRKMQQDENAGYVLFPDFSPRRILVDLATGDQEERFLAKNIVNRTWQRLMGLGLVDPPDQLHEANPPSHPELLQWLTRDLVAHGYDLRRLIRGIVLSSAYARSSEWTVEDTPPPQSTYAVAATRPLTPRQFAASLWVAVRNPDQWPAADEPDRWVGVRKDLENHAGGWAGEFEQPGENFQVAVDEALFFSNSQRVQNELLGDGGDRIIGVLKAIDSEDEVAERLWANVLSRSPTDEERQAAIDWLRRDSDDRSSSIRSLAWALLAGPEARFNH
jgi:hypothetical protein